jgi:pSer/pThr/pTyr-binding forkhead associated (FHA) protein
MVQADLRVLGGKFQGKLIPLTSRKFLVGREQDCHLRPNNDLVSRHHCVFLTDDYGVRLRDLGSTNGTRVNGELVRSERLLKAGDKITIGKLELELVIRTAAPVAAPARPAPQAPVGAGVSAPVGPLGGSDDSGELPTSDLSGDSATSLEVAPTSSSETSFELPVFPGASETQVPGSIQPGDTSIIPQTGGMPQGVPPVGYPQMGYPGYPPGYGYPMAMPGYGQAMPGYGVPMPGYPMMMPGYGMPTAPAMPAAPAAEPAKPKAPMEDAIPPKLPPPEATGVRAPPPPPPPPAPAADGSVPEAPKVEKPSQSAEDIIKKYMQRRGSK